MMKYHETEESYAEYKKDLEDQGYKLPTTICIYPVLCECGRLYKDRRNEEGKMMCSLCHTGLDMESLRKFWGNHVDR